MQDVKPQVYLVSAPALDYEAIEQYLKGVGGESWLERIDEDDDPQNLVEFAGRFCYRSWEPGLNPNVTRIRTDQAKYMENLLASRHGSVLEHAQFTFALHHVSRVFCYDSETEVLTSTGWVPWPDIKGDETFATLNPATGDLEYQRATGVVHSDYEGPMYRVSSEQVDLLVTPNHRMWVQPYDTQAAKRGEQPFVVKRAEEIIHKRVKYQKSAHWEGKTPERVEISGTSRSWVRSDNGAAAKREYSGVSFPARPFAEFLGYYVAEGSVNGHQICLAQNRGPSLERMAETIREMGLPAYLPETGNGAVRTQCTALRDFLADLGHSHEKFVPEMVHNWDREAIRIFLDAVIEGDGTTHKQSGHQVIYTASKKLADDLQILAIKAGWSANIRIDDRIGLERVMPSGQRFQDKRVGYIVSILTNRLNPLINHNRKNPSRYWNDEGYNDQIEHYAGKIHCVKVPNGLLWVRRNGKPVVSGNTHEQVRHRVGTAISQESLRFVRLDDIPFWFPEWAHGDDELMHRAMGLLAEMEQFQNWMAGRLRPRRARRSVRREEGEDLLHAPVRTGGCGHRHDLEREHPHPAAHHRDPHGGRGRGGDQDRL